MLFHLSQLFLPFFLHPLVSPRLSSCPWIVHISSLASLFPIQFFFLLLFKYSCLNLHPTMTPAPPIPASTLEPTPFGFVHVSFIHVPRRAFPYYPSPASSLVSVRLFFISMSLVVFCLLVCFVD